MGIKMTREMYIPKVGVSATIERPDLKSVVYFLEPGEKILALGFSGKREKPDFYYRFDSNEKRLSYVDRYFDSLIEMRNNKNKWREQRQQEAASFLERLTPGTILYDTWGYEQTNVEFYKVLERKGSRVKIVELSHETVRATGWASSVVIPGQETIGQPVWKIVRGGRVKICESISLGIYTGGEIHKSWYA